MRFVSRMTIHDWSETEGAKGDALGVVSFRGLRIAKAPAGSFEKPADAREDLLPG